MTIKNPPFIALIKKLIGMGYTVEENHRVGTRGGFRVTLPNNWLVSVQYRWGAYCTSAHNWELLRHGVKFNDVTVDEFYGTPPGGWIAIAIDAEIAAWHLSNKEDWYRFSESQDDMVKGWQDVDQVFMFIQLIADRADAPQSLPDFSKDE